MQTTALFDLPYAQARALVATGVPVYLTVNPVEYHGPHLSLHNDRLVSVGLCRRLHEAVRATHPEWPFVLAEDLEIGAEPCRGEGSRTISFRDERALVVDAVAALCALGVRRLVVMTFHGGPLHNLAIEAGLRHARARGVRAIAPLPLLLDTLVELDDPWTYRDVLETIPDPADRTRVADRLREDVHAGFFETSMALALAPASVDPSYVSLPECPPYDDEPRFARAAAVARALGQRRLARELGLAARAGGWGALEPFPGYTSAPHLASVAAGEAFIRHLLAVSLPVTLDVLEGRSDGPPPVFSWIETVTFDGRLAPTPSFARHR